MSAQQQGLLKMEGLKIEKLSNLVNLPSFIDSRRKK